MQHARYIPGAATANGAVPVAVLDDPFLDRPGLVKFGGRTGRDLVGDFLLRTDE
jgi:sugar/nucleoside kinase (ribokinase family)